jgi:integrase
MSVKPRGDSFQATVHWKGRRWRKDFNTEVEALAWEASTLDAVKAGGTPEGDTKGGKITTFGQLAEHVIETHWKIKGQSSAEWSIRNARELVSYFGSTARIEAINYKAIEAFKTVLLRKGKAHGTVNRKLATLSRILTEGQKLELTPRKPVIDFLKETEGRIRTVSDTEERQLVAVAFKQGDRDMADYITLSIETGMRQGEALKITTKHCTPAALVLDGRICKSGKGRAIPLTDKAKAVLARRLETTEPGGRVFVHLTKAAIRHRWNTLLELCQIEDETLVPHTMRHTFCSRLADLGAEAPAIQMLAGHSTLAMSQRYIHMSARGLAQTIALLNAPQATPDATPPSVAQSNPEVDTSNVLVLKRKSL